LRHDDPCLTLDEEGWTWTAQVRPAVYQWIRMLFAGRLPAHDWRPAGFQHLSSLAPARGADVTWRQVAAPAGPGYFLVGDAAVVLDPTASHGVLRALMSGIMAGHLISRLGLAPTDSATIAITGEYNQWLKAWFHHDLAQLRELYRRLEPPKLSRNDFKTGDYMTRVSRDAASLVGISKRVTSERADTFLSSLG
jgi:flavin-dependent dehydrogenase